MRDLVSRLDSARMSAIFAESLSTATAVDSDDFLSPRTEVSIEDVRKLQVGRGEKLAGRFSKGKQPPVPRPSFPRVKAVGARPKATPATGPPPLVRPKKPLFSRSFLRSDTGDAESWLVSSPTGSGHAEGLDEILSCGGSSQGKESVLRPPSAGSDSKSSTVTDPPKSPELKAFVDERANSPPPSRIPRTKVNSVINEDVEVSRHVKRKSSVPDLSIKTREGYEEEKKGSFSFFPRAWSRRRSLSTMSETTPMEDCAGAALDGLKCIPRTPSITSLVSESAEGSGVPTSPKSEIISSRRAPVAVEGVTIFGRRKEFRFDTRLAGKIPVLHYKNGKEASI